MSGQNRDVQPFGETALAVNAEIDAISTILDIDSTKMFHVTENSTFWSGGEYSRVFLQNLAQGIITLKSAESLDANVQKNTIEMIARAVQTPPSLVGYVQIFSSKAAEAHDKELESLTSIYADGFARLTSYFMFPTFIPEAEHIVGVCQDMSTKGAPIINLSTELDAKKVQREIYEHTERVDNLFFEHGTDIRQFFGHLVLSHGRRAYAVGTKPVSFRTET